MDTRTLETTAQRYKKADDTLNAAREALQAEALEALRSGLKQAEVARITGWSREYVRRLKAEEDKRAEVEALRRKVAELERAKTSDPSP